MAATTYSVDVEAVSNVTRHYPPPMEIPYLCEGWPACSPEQFRSWPNLQGWSWNLADIPLETFAAQAQSWLFFGLLAIACPDISANDLVITTLAGTKLVDWHKVEPIVRALPRDFISLPDMRKPSKLYEAMTTAKDFFNDIVIDYLCAVDEGGLDLWTSKSHAAVFIIDVLLDILLSRQIVGHKQRLLAVESLWRSPLVLSSHMTNRCSLTSQVLTMRATAQRFGLCPSLASRSRLSSNAIFQLISHGQSQASMYQHTDCNATECWGYHVDETNYKPKHVDVCEGCEFVYANPKRLEKIISAGKIPLMCCSEDQAGNVDCSIVEGDLHSTFVAISHVWSGGLGNKTHNAIPACQLKYLLSTVLSRDFQKHSEKSVTFFPHFYEKFVLRIAGQFPKDTSVQGVAYLWLDTMCVPRGPKEAHKQAIDTIGLIYAAAAHVLVLDPDLQRTMVGNLRHSVPELFNIVIAASPWMSRGWTLEECAVSSNVLIKFADALEPLTKTSKKKLCIPLLDLKEHIDMRGADSEYINACKVQRFTNVWNALISRSTSKEEDAHAIFGVLLDCSAKEILATKQYSDQMKAIIANQERVPLSLLVSNYNFKTGRDSNSSWIPLFPGSARDAAMLRLADGDLEIVDTGFKLCSEVSPQLFVMGFDTITAPFSVRPINEERQYRIYPGEAFARSKAPAAEDAYVFVLTKTPVPGTKELVGSRLKVIDRRGSEYTTTLDGIVTWHEESWELVNIEDTDGSPDRIIPGAEISGLDIEIRIEDFERWPRFSFKRDKQFAFLSFANQTHYSMAIATIMTIALLSYIASNAFQASKFFVYAMSWSMIYMLLFESVIWRNRMFYFTRKWWAASFQTKGMLLKEGLQEEQSIWIIFQSFGPALRIAAPLAIVSGLTGLHGTFELCISLIVYAITRLLIFQFLRMARIKAAINFLFRVYKISHFAVLVGISSAIVQTYVLILTTVAIDCNPILYWTGLSLCAVVVVYPIAGPKSHDHEFHFWTGVRVSNYIHLVE